MNDFPNTGFLQRSKNPVFMANYPGWGFYRFNPWRERFDEVIQNVLQAGLIDHWKQNTWVRMKVEQSTGRLWIRDPERN